MENLASRQNSMEQKKLPSSTLDVPCTDWISNGTVLRLLCECGGGLWIAVSVSTGGLDDTLAASPKGRRK